MTRVRVLLADDHRILAEGLKSLLVPEFDLIGVVGDGRAMIEAAKALKPDVIVADITMPQLNGIEALEEIKKFDPYIRVIFLTMHRDVAYARRALEAGVRSASRPSIRRLANCVTAVRRSAAGAYSSARLFPERVAGNGSNITGDTADPVASLTLRQREILRLLVDVPVDSGNRVQAHISARDG